MNDKTTKSKNGTTTTSREHSHNSGSPQGDGDVMELVFVLDRSGSMGGLERDTIDSFNETIAKHREGHGEVLVSLVLFDDESEVLLSRMPIRDVKPLTEKEYCVKGCTALNDAVGDAITHIVRVHRHLGDRKPSCTMFVINTDGCENASRRYSADRIREMIRNEEKNYDWKFLFLASNINAEESAATIGISAAFAVNVVHDADGQKASYHSVSKAIHKMRCREGVSGSDWREEADRDFATRGR